MTGSGWWRRGWLPGPPARNGLPEPYSWRRPPARLTPGQVQLLSLLEQEPRTAAALGLKMRRTAAAVRYAAIPLIERRLVDDAFGILAITAEGRQVLARSR